MSYVDAFTPTPRRSLLSSGARQSFRGPDATHSFRGPDVTHSFRGPDGPTDRGEDEVDGVRQDIDLRQLRHHTKNTLQRILGLIADAPGLSDTPQGEKIVQELEYRICLSATISDALFGLTDAPGSLAERLRQLAGAVVEMMRDADQVIRVGVSVRGCCPADLREAVLRSAHELISNAVKHGMKGRSSGRINVRVTTDEDCTTLTVLDNGWGFTGTPRPGEGLALARGLAARHGGSLLMDGEDGTVATLELPHCGRDSIPLGVNASGVAQRQRHQLGVEEV